MDYKEHIKRHKNLHRSLDELITDFVYHTNKFPSKTTLVEFMQWSYLQTTSPTAEEVEEVKDKTKKAGEK